MNVYFKLQNYESLHKTINHFNFKFMFDIFTLKTKDYLLLADYVSDLFMCELLLDLQLRSAIKACKKPSSRHRAPCQVHSDNGSQVTSDEFVRFSKKWGFYHIAFSSSHWQSNSKTESSVKIITRLMKKADDLYLALLEYCNTQTAGMNTSPAEKMFGHSTSSILPTS